MDETIRIADAGAATSAALATLSWVAQLNAFLTIVATTVAIIAGCMAALYHYEAWRQKRANR